MQHHRASNALVTKLCLGSEEQQSHTVVLERIERSELVERGLQDSLEELFLTIPEMSDDGKIEVMGYSMEAEGQSFEVRAALCASFASIKHLKTWVERYSARATKERWKPLSYNYAKKLSRVGGRFAVAGKRITRDFPMLTPYFFVQALYAGKVGQTDEEAVSAYFKALEMAEEKFEAHQNDPKTVPELTTRGFLELIGKTPAAPSVPNAASACAGTPAKDEAASDDEEKSNSEPSAVSTEPLVIEETVREKGVGVFKIAATIDPSTGTLIESNVTCLASLGDGLPQDTVAPVSDEAVQPDVPSTKLSDKSCYDCSRCQELKTHQRVALVEVTEAGNVKEVLGIFQPAVMWYCASKKILISVRTQQFERAVGIAKDCPDLDAVGIQESGSQEESPLSVDEFMNKSEIPA